MMHDGVIPGSAGDVERDYEAELLPGVDFAALGDEDLRKVAVDFADAYERQAYVVGWLSAPCDVVAMTEGEKRHEVIERQHLDRMTLRYFQLQAVLDDRGWRGIGWMPASSSTPAPGGAVSTR